MARYANWIGLLSTWWRGIKVHKNLVKANELSMTPGKETGKLNQIYKVPVMLNEVGCILRNFQKLSICLTHLPLASYTLMSQHYSHLIYNRPWLHLGLQQDNYHSSHVTYSKYENDA